MCENFSRELVKVVIAQITQALGFHGIQQSACETLADIMQLYIEELGYSSHLYAEHATRTESNFHDINGSFEDLGVSVTDLFTFITQFEEIPFAKAVPPFPLPKKETPHPPDLAEKEELPHPDHIPSFLPSFPPRHTYAHTPLYAERITDARTLRREKSKQKRHLERSLYDLSTKMGAKPVASYEELIQQRANPFLAPPKQAKSQQTKSADVVTPQSDKIIHDASPVLPTPLTDLTPYADVITEEVPPEKPAPTITAMDIDDFERQKKRAKVEKILSLSHQDGIVESLDMPGSSTADKDEKMMSP